MKILDLSFYQEPEHDPEKVLEKHAASSGHIQLLGKKHEITVLKFCEAEEMFARSGVHYRFAPLPNIRKLRSFLEKLLNDIKPDLVLLHSFVFPLYSWQLAQILTNRAKLVIQHHADRPSKNPFKFWMQRLAFSQADAYFFVSSIQALPFLRSGIAGSQARVAEIMEGSNYFSPAGSKKRNRILWVGRFIRKKDPLTFLRAVTLLRDQGYDLECRICTSGGPMESVVRRFLKKSRLDATVTIEKNVPHDEMETTYRSAGIFVSTSKEEGSSWALSEAMACGCIPILTRIPSFLKMNAAPELDYFFETGDVGSLRDLLAAVLKSEQSELWQKAALHFENHLSFRAISEAMDKMFIQIQKAPG